jgi:serine/threonine protein kinase
MRLSALHAEGLWHLDLSPDNIYIVPSAGHTRLVPYIIDYGSAYDRKNPDEEKSHRYTCNPFSPPEIMALAQLQDLACGYAPDESSDTYALVSILFYGLTGQVFSADHRLVATNWKDRFQKEYSAGLPSHQGAVSFASKLIAFLEQGLAASQSGRFTGAKELLQGLRNLKTQYREYGNLLPLVDQDELMSYMVLEKHPLYHYKGSDGNIHVLCLGSGAFVKRMILSLLSCGQMVGSHLFIHVVSDKPENLLKEYLLTVAPELEHYSNLTGNAKVEYVTFSYDQVPDLTQPQACKEVLTKYPNARYVLISLGNNSTNLLAARVYARGFAENPGTKPQKAILNYYCSEDAANMICSVADGGALPEWIEIAAFGNNLSSYSKTIRTLGLRVLKLAHLYEKLGDANTSLSETARKLSANQYNQRSSCASTLHLKYKLASIGINPANTTNKKAIISAYLKYLCSGQVGTLLELEHRRWMMYMIADGYRLPTTEDLQRYGFEMVEDRFNRAWKCVPKKLHPCLVPCGSNGITLNNEDFHTYTDFAQIDASSFDPLDQTSLRLHLMAKKKCQRIARSKVVEGYFCAIASRLSDIKPEKNTDDDSSLLYSKLETMLKEVREDICVAVQTLRYTEEDDHLAELQRIFDNFGINIRDEISNLRKCLSVFVEYAVCRDYKVADDAIIRNLLWILYADNDITMIKLHGRTIVDNITGPLILDPHRLVFFGEDPHPEWNRFLQKHGSRGQISYIQQSGTTVPQICDALNSIVLQQRTCCVIDVTGASEEAVIAAMRVADANSQVCLIRSTTEGTVENIHRFVAAPVYTLHTAIEPDEIFSLYGAQEIQTSVSYMGQLENAVPTMWAFYQEFRQDWTRVTAFFANRGTGSSELWIRNIVISPETQWKTYSKKIDTAKWNALELQSVFQKLEDAGILQKVTTEEYIPGRMRLEFLYPSMDDAGNGDYFHKALDNFFNQKILSIFVPMQCDIRHNPQSGYTIDVKSGCRVEIYDKNDVDFSDKRVQSGNRPRYTYASIVPALKRLEELRLIADLDISGSAQGLPVSIKFIYTNPAVRDCLVVAGNVLELYIWREARQTGFFDNVQSNFCFSWKEGVRNELDVIMTKGLKALVVSAKTARLNKEHLYEIKYLTEKFSLNSKPVIIYSSDLAYEDGHLTGDLSAVKRRAKAMGIWLIDLNETDGSLGAKLVQIANEKAP